MAGIRHFTVLGRSGHVGAGSDLAHAMRDGWAASVALLKCDVAFSEDTAAVFSRHQSSGKPAVYEPLSGTFYTTNQAVSYGVMRLPDFWLL